ncbi:FHA domain-containing protein, partial [Paenibacillus sp. TAF58]
VNLPILSVAGKKLEPTQAASTPEPINIQNYYENLHMRTTLLNHKKPNATIFLGSLVNQPLGARIEWQFEGTTKSVPLKNDHFTMGRGDASLNVDYVLDEAGASRLHAEITKNEEGYVIKDTGSTNGTYLNGEPLVTYQPYPLKDGDKIRIVRQEIKFRI